eukprot:6212700-Pleurochrysis_carterae.AAC.3
MAEVPCTCTPRADSSDPTAQETPPPCRRACVLVIRTPSNSASQRPSRLTPPPFCSEYAVSISTFESVSVEPSHATAPPSPSLKPLSRRLRTHAQKHAGNSARVAARTTARTHARTPAHPHARPHARAHPRTLAHSSTELDRGAFVNGHTG